MSDHPEIDLARLKELEGLLSKAIVALCEIGRELALVGERFKSRQAGVTEHVSKDTPRCYHADSQQGQ